MQPKQIFQEFKEIHRRTPFKWEDKRCVWTRKILEHFCELGDKKGLIGTNTRYWKKNEKSKPDKRGFRKIRVHGKQVEVTGEYLVDLCWYKTEPYFVELALEIEWRPWSDYDKRDPDWDFYKLIDIKAPLKIWISSVPKKRKQSELELLHEILKKTEMRIRGKERYLIVLFPSSETDLWIQGYEGDHEIGLRSKRGWREIGTFRIAK